MTARTAPPALDYVYLITRLDIPPVHRTVQLAHAAYAASLAFGSTKVSHPNLVVCAVDNERQLIDAFEELKAAGVPCCLWREEDMGSEATAIGTGMLRREQRKALRRFRLLN